MSEISLVNEKVLASYVFMRFQTVFGVEKNCITALTLFQWNFSAGTDID